jgi:hypothetical protein
VLSIGLENFKDPDSLNQGPDIYESGSGSRLLLILDPNPD